MRTPSYEEALYMAAIKRKRAKDALSKVVEKYGVISHDPAPGLDVLLDYFVNIVYAIELVMKVVSRDWDVPNESKNKHDVGKMYKEIFGKEYGKSDLMKVLKEAIQDQKFIYEPSGDLAGRIPEIEELWDEIKGEYYRRNFRTVHFLNKTVKLNQAFMDYLYHNLERFYMPEWKPIDRRTTEERIAEAEGRVQMIQEYIKHLKASPEQGEVPMCERMEEARRAYERQLEDFRSIMALTFPRMASIEFCTTLGRAVVSDFLG